MHRSTTAAPYAADLVVEELGQVTTPLRVFIVVGPYNGSASDFACAETAEGHDNDEGASMPMQHFGELDEAYACAQKWTHETGKQYKVALVMHGLAVRPEVRTS